MRKLLFLKVFIISTLIFFYSSSFSQTKDLGLYLAISPNLQFASKAYKPQENSLKVYPFFGGYLNLGYTKKLNANFFGDICVGYNVKSFKYNYHNIASGTEVVGKIESNFNLGYINTIDSKRSMLVHIGYGIDFFGTKDTLFFQSDNLTTQSFGTQQPNMYLEIGFGILHKRILRNIYTGISLKKGFVKSHEVQFFYNDNGNLQFSNVISFQDNLSFNIKYYFRRTKSIPLPTNE